MASISLYESEKIRETLTRGQQKQIRDIYRNVAEKMAKEAERLAGKDNTSSVLRRQWLNDMQKKLNVEIENIGGDVQKIITDTMTKAAQAVVDDNISFFEKHNISMKGAFQNVPADIVERVATGKLYNGNWTLTKTLRKDIMYMQKDIHTIVAEGIAGNKSSYEIAKDLEAYIDPAVKKPWDWSKVYPVSNEKWNWTKKTIDYNAQRLARTMVSHAYQQSLVQTVKYNPFVEYIRWRSSASSMRVCKQCDNMNNRLFPKDNLPLDHPNGLCTFIPEIGSLDDVAERLADWANGKEDSELDKFYEKAYQGDAEKISSKALKKSEKSGIIDTGSDKLNIDVTGASGAIPRNNINRMDEHAEKYYEEIRKRKSDIETIAKNTNFSIEDIRIIKEHIFFNEYDLGDEIPERFAPDYDMSVSWQRLIDGKNIQEMDIVLLNHELMEYGLMEQGLSYNEAHRIAEKSYDYKKFTDELDKIFRDKTTERSLPNE